MDISAAVDGEDKFDRRGIVDFTDNRVDYNRGTLQFRAKLENKDHSLNHGLFVRVRLPIGDAHRAVMIRERALVTEHRVVDGVQVREKGVYVLVDRDEKGQPIKDSGDAKGQTSAMSQGRLEAGWQPRRACATGSWRSNAECAPGDWVVVSGMQRLKRDKQEQMVKAEKFVEDTPVEEATRTAHSTAPAALRDGSRESRVIERIPSPCLEQTR